MTTNHEQVQMVWPVDLLEKPPVVKVPVGYKLRAYQQGDEPAFFNLMDSVGWRGWDDEKLRPWLYRILPEGWFMAVDEASGEIAATCMATHDHTWQVPFCGEVGWTAAHPDHQGKGLGRAVVSAVVGRFLQAGYSIIHLYTEVWRLPALKMYLRLDFVPYGVEEEEERLKWERIYEQLGVE